MADPLEIKIIPPDSQQKPAKAVAKTAQRRTRQPAVKPREEDSGRSASAADVTPFPGSYADSETSSEFDPMAPNRDAYAAETRYPTDPSEIRANLTEPPDRRGDPMEDAKAGPPSLSEWQNFIARTVLRAITEAWLYLCLGDLVMQLDQTELALITLTKEQYNEMSAPLASLANKSKLARRHGRLIISTADSFNALFELAIWMNRVRRIAKRHRPAAQQVRRNKAAHTHDGGLAHGTNGFNEAAASDIPTLGVWNPGTG